MSKGLTVCAPCPQTSRTAQSTVKQLQTCIQKQVTPFHPVRGLWSSWVCWRLTMGLMTVSLITSATLIMSRTKGGLNYDSLITSTTLIISSTKGLNYASVQSSMTQNAALQSKKKGTACLPQITKNVISPICHLYSKTREFPIHQRLSAGPSLICLDFYFHNSGLWPYSNYAKFSLKQSSHCNFVKSNIRHQVCINNVHSLLW